ncbi:MAG: MFS transporter [Tepidiformaceae bacterium]
MPTGRLLDAEHRSLTIGLVLAVTLVAFEALAVATVMPVARDDLGGLRFYAWAFSAFLLASLVSITWAGAECDRRGPARPLALALILFGVGLAIASVAPSMPVLVLGRAVQGFGAGALSSVAYVSIGRGFEEELRPRMFAVLSSAWVIPGLAGPALAAAVAEYVGWRAVFGGLLPLLGIAAYLVLPALSRLGPPAIVAPPEQRTPRLRGALRLSTGVGLVLAAVTSPSLLLGAPLIPLGLVVAVPAFLRLVPSGTVTLRRGSSAAVAGMGLLNLAFFGAETFIPLAFKEIRGESTLISGLVLTAATLSWTAGAWLAERLGRRIDRRTLAWPGALLLALGIAGVSTTVFPSVPVAFVTASWAVAGLGIGLAYSTFSLVVLAAATEGSEGAAASGMKLAEVLGSAVGIGLGGALIAAGEAAGREQMATFAVFAATALAGLLCAYAGSRLISHPAASVPDTGQAHPTSIRVPEL